jgi:hypothetical protein
MAGRFLSWKCLNVSDKLKRFELSFSSQEQDLCIVDENFPGNPDFSSDFRVFQSGCCFLGENDPKCNNMTTKALKLHLQSIKLQKSFYSSNFCYFTCAVMS